MDRKGLCTMIFYFFDCRDLRSYGLQHLYVRYDLRDRSFSRYNETSYLDRFYYRDAPWICDGVLLQRKKITISI